MDDYKNLDIYKSFIKSELFCTKANIYFHVYEEIFQKFRNKKITFVEIGVQRGGSLLMWRDWLGPDARIIGVDLDPNAKKMEKYGFEIFIGDQSSPNFWNNFFKKVGNVDVVLDDGAHTNEAQTLTTINSINYINDGGLIVIEDASSSYLKKFFNPQKYSFINYCKFLIDDIYVRSLKQDIKEKFKKKYSLNDKLYSIKFFPDFVIFEINKAKCFNTKYFWNKDIDNKSVDEIAETYNYVNPRWTTKSYKGSLNNLILFFSKTLFFLKYIPYMKYFVKKIILFKTRFYDKKISSNIKKYFE
tara:strand:+ start:9969 stop:10871 length:903 start_codon:yes stop_codon:yes gene_type:complete